MVEFTDLSLRVKVPGSLSDEELDNIMLFLSNRASSQEAKELKQLHAFYDALEKLAFKDYFMVSEEADARRSEALKENITEYFSTTPCEQVASIEVRERPDRNEGFIQSQCRDFVNLYFHEHELTGLTVAKILYGITTPNFPAQVWGRVYRFWRSLIGQDFHTIERLATRELISCV